MCGRAGNVMIVIVLQDSVVVAGGLVHGLVNTGSRVLILILKLAGVNPLVPSKQGTREQVFESHS